MLNKNMKNQKLIVGTWDLPLLTYIGGPKGEALHLSIES
jgi:hypothetical protein